MSKPPVSPETPSERDILAASPPVPGSARSPHRLRRRATEDDYDYGDIETVAVRTSRCRNQAVTGDNPMSTETQRRTLTVETEICPTRQIADGQRLAWDGDGAISMTVRIGPHSIWFDKETSPVGLKLSTDASAGDTPSWPIGGGVRRPSAAWKLATLLQSGWKLVDDDVGLNR